MGWINAVKEAKQHHSKYKAAAKKYPGNRDLSAYITFVENI